MSMALPPGLLIQNDYEIHIWPQSLLAKTVICYYKWTITLCEAKIKRHSPLKLNGYLFISTITDHLNTTGETLHIDRAEPAAYEVNNMQTSP